MSAKIRVGVLGARGRMGAEVVKAVSNSSDLELVAELLQGMSFVRDDADFDLDLCSLVLRLLLLLDEDDGVARVLDFEDLMTHVDLGIYD